MSQFLDFDGLSLYDTNVKKRTSEGYYNKDEIDNLLSGLEMNILWKDAVATYNDIATTYPYPQEGWTVTVLDTGETYRYDGTRWVKISASVIPKATANNDGLMPKEMYSKVDELGTASEKDYTVDVDTSTDIPTSLAVKTYVDSSITSKSAELKTLLEAEIDEKVSISDVGSSSARNYTDSIPEESDRIGIKGEWYSDDGADMFYLEGTGVDNGIDLTFVESVNTYVLHMYLDNYSSAIVPVLHFIGTKTVSGETVEIDTYYSEGDSIIIDNVPDEYLAGTDSASLEVNIPNYESDVRSIDSLIYPVFYDEANDVDIPLVDKTKYTSGKIIHQEYDGESHNHILTGKYDTYSSADLPTATAVSHLVDSAVSGLEDLIDEVEAKIDDYEEATDEDIEALFDLGDDVTDEDIENLFSL